MSIPPSRGADRDVLWIVANPGRLARPADRSATRMKQCLPPAGGPVIRGEMNPAISVWKRTRGTKDLRARRVAGQYEDNGDIDSQRIYLCGFTVTGSPRWLMRGGAPTCRIRRW